MRQGEPPGGSEGMVLFACVNCSTPLTSLALRFPRQLPVTPVTRTSLNTMSVALVVVMSYGRPVKATRPHSGFGGLAIVSVATSVPLGSVVEKIGRASCRERVCQYV